jgi:hypothetical protein
MRSFDNDPDTIKYHTVPYTNRTRYISQPIPVERKIGEEEFEKSKNNYNIILHTHPCAVRVTNILNKIIHALYIEKDKMNSASSKYTRWSHLDGLNWEVLVVDASYVHAYSHAGGKIVITVASICRHTDQQLATILVHEVCFFFLGLCVGRIGLGLTKIKTRTT